MWALNNDEGTYFTLNFLLFSHEISEQWNTRTCMTQSRDRHQERERICPQQNQHLNSYIASECVSVVAGKHPSGKAQGFHYTHRNQFLFSFCIQWDISFVYFRQGNILNLKDSPKFMCSWFGPGLMVLLKDDLIMWALRWTIEVSVFL